MLTHETKNHTVVSDHNKQGHGAHSVLNIPYQFRQAAPEMVVVAHQCDAVKWLLLVLKKDKGENDLIPSWP